MKTRKLTLTTAVAVAMGMAGNAGGSVNSNSTSTIDTSELTADMLESALITTTDRGISEDKPLQFEKVAARKKAAPKRKKAAPKR